MIPLPFSIVGLCVLARDAASGQRRAYASTGAGFPVAACAVLGEQRLAASGVTRHDRTGRSRGSLVLRRMELGEREDARRDADKQHRRDDD